MLVKNNSSLTPVEKKISWQTTIFEFLILAVYAPCKRVFSSAVQVSRQMSQPEIS